MVLASAKKFRSRAEFQTNEIVAYRTMCKNGWRKAIYREMTDAWSMRSPMRQVYELTATCPDSGLTLIYVGLSINADARLYRHKARGTAAVQRLIGLPDFNNKILRNGKLLIESDAARLEQRLIAKYQKDPAFIVLNVGSKAGHLGRNYCKWTEERIASEAKKYKTRHAFKHGCGSAYQAAIRLCILGNVCKNMVPHKRLPSKWDNKALIKEAKKYTHRSDFFYGSKAAYNRASKIGLLDQICRHMTPKPRG